MKSTIIVGHPDPSEERLNRVLAGRYAQAMTAAGGEVRVVDVSRLEFPILRTYDDFFKGTAPEAVQAAQHDIAWADQLVFFFPLWIGDMPALLKGLIEQLFRPGLVVAAGDRSGKRLLGGKSARLVVTMGMPALVYRSYFGAHMIKSLTRMLRMIGVAPVRVTLVGNAGAPGEKDCSRWLGRMECLARSDMRRRHAWGERPIRVVAGFGLVAAAAYLSYAAVAWARFGNTKRASSLLDESMPQYDVCLDHETKIDAPAALAFDAMRETDLERSPIVQALFRARQILMRGHHPEREPRHALLEQLDDLGWRIVGEETGRELVFGAVTKPWESEPVFRGLSPVEFKRFDIPGYVKIAFNLRIDPLGEHASIARTQTRALATDPQSRRRFRRYWVLLSPGIEMVRIVLLAQLRAEAEERAKGQGATAGR